MAKKNWALNESSYQNTPGQYMYLLFLSIAEKYDKRFGQYKIKGKIK